MPSSRGTFDKKAFIAAVKAAIEAKSPKTLKEADDYKESGKAGRSRARSKAWSPRARRVRPRTSRPPPRRRRTSRRRCRSRSRRWHRGARGSAGPIPAAGAVPKPAPAEQLNLAAGKHAGRTRRWPTPRSPSSSWRSRTNRSSSRRLADKQAAAAHADTRPGSSASRSRRSSQQGKAEAAAETTAGVTGMQGAKGAALAKLVADKGKTKSKDEAKRAEVTDEDPEHLHRHRDRREEDPRRHRPEGREGVRAGRSRGPVGVRELRRREDVGLQGGSLQRLARRVALGQGQDARDARQGQRVLRGRPRALPQADGQGDLAGRGHRRRRPDRGEGADRERARRDRHLRQEPAERPAEGRFRGVEGDRRQVRAARERRRRQAGVGGRHPGHEVRRGPQGPRRADRGSCRPRTRAWSTRRSGRSRPSSTRSASSSRC